jgi:Ulp1 family protease
MKGRRKERESTKADNNRRSKVIQRVSNKDARGLKPQQLQKREQISSKLTRLSWREKPANNTMTIIPKLFHGHSTAKGFLNDQLAYS